MAPPDYLSYEPIYVSRDAIASMLQGRLTIYPEASAFGGKVVDELTFKRATFLQEGFVNQVLGSIYNIPLVNEHPIVIDSAEHLVAAELLKQKFQPSPVPNEATDVNSAMQNYRSYGLQLLRAIVGRHVDIPGMMPIPDNPGMTTQEPIVLPGESLAPKRDDTFTKNDMAIGTKKHTKDSLGIDWGDGQGTHVNNAPIWREQEGDWWYK